MFGKIIMWLRGVVQKMLNFGGTKIAGGVDIAVSSLMAAAIQRWHDEYVGNAYWLNQNRQSLQLPSLIASKMATLVTLEAKVTLGGSARAKWLTEQLQPFLNRLHQNVEYACAMGGIVMKPYPDDGNIAIDYILADDFYPVAFNGRGEITAAVFVERKHIGQLVYSRVEFHNSANGTYTIVNECYKGYSDNDIGTRCELTEVDEWQDIKPLVTIRGMKGNLFAYFRIPLGNVIEPKSPLGVSVYAKAEENMKEADFQYQRLLWEYKGGELAIDASEDAFELDKFGRAIIPAGMERLYRKNTLDPRNGSQGIFDTFAPELRDAAYRSGLNDILKIIEDQTGLARGSLSDVNQEAKTATEIRTNRQNTYATVTQIQTALQNAIENLVRAMDAVATLYSLAPAGTYNVACVWDDSVVIDAESERMRDMQEVREGLMQKWEYRVKWYGEDEQTAKMMTQTQMTDDEVMGFYAPNTPRRNDNRDNPQPEQKEE